MRTELRDIALACLTLVCQVGMSFAQASFVCRTACACSLCVYIEDVMSGEDDKEYLPLRQNPWRSVVIDAITVDIKSESVVNVMMPVAAPLLSPHWSWKECENHPESDPALLCQQLSLSAARFFKRSPYCIRLAARHPGTTFEHFTGTVSYTHLRAHET